MLARKRRPEWLPGKNKILMRTRLIKGLIWLFSRLNLGISHHIGAIFGYIVWIFPTNTRKVALKNIALCFPEFSARQRNQLAKQSLIEAGKTLLEFGPLWSLDSGRFEQLLIAEEGADAVHAARAAGRGIILATPHLGSWEMGGHYCAQRWQITSLYRPPRMKDLEAVLVEGRSQLGARLVPTSAQGVRILYETLQNGGAVGILPDQDPGSSGGTFAPFFGIPANTMVLLNRLARKTGAAVFLGFCERLPQASGYKIHIIPAPEGIDSDDPEVAASALNSGVEQLVRMKPEQYQWGYRRFRTRPEGEQKIY